MDNYSSLLNLKYKEHISVFILPIVIIVLLVLSFTIEVYDNIQTNYVFNNNSFVITIPIQYSDIVINADYLIINKNKYTYKVESIINEIDKQSLIITISNKTDQMDNQIGTAVFYYNKEKIIKKVVNLLF